MKYVKDCVNNEKVQSIWLCKKKKVGTTNAGQEYITLSVQDKTGILPVKIWNPARQVKSDFNEGDFISVSGTISTYNDALQLTADSVSLANKAYVNMEDYVPTTKKDMHQLKADFSAMLNSVIDPYLSQLLTNVFKKDAAFAKEFAVHSAAKTVHHGYVGGLMEHSLAVATICDFLAKRYPLINRDLLVSAALLHDCGKVWETSRFPENDYTDRGKLLGHIYMGARYLSRQMDKIEGFPEEMKLEMEHCILSHHGSLEFGAPKVPATIEAEALTYADNTDAHLQIFTEAIDKMTEKGEKWSDYNRFVDSNIMVSGAGTQMQTAPAAAPVPAYASPVQTSAPVYPDYQMYAES